jgi:hypothetical protein
MGKVFLAMAVTGFIGLGVVEVWEGDYKKGVSSLLLAIVNGALLS